MLRLSAVRLLTWLAVLTALAAALLGGLQFTVPDVANRLRDDAFYEFAWAANVASGRGPMVSDGVTTSGVQLLWSSLLVPLAWLFGPASLPVLAPWLGVVLHVATALAWLRGCSDRVTGICVALVWLGHPLLVRECQNGQETALACFLATLLWLGRGSSESRFMLLGVLGVLARSDLLPYVVALSVWRHRAALLGSVSAPLLALGVHLGLNRLLGGGFLPDSALPMAWLWHHQGDVFDPSLSGFVARSWWYLRPVLLGGPFALASAMGCGFLCFVCIRPWWPAKWRALPAVVVGVLHASSVHDLATPGWTALLLLLLPAARRRRVRCNLLLPFLGLAAIVVLHWAVRWYPRDYYVAPLVVAAMAALARYGRLRLLLFVFALAQIVDAGRVQPEPLAGQREMALAGRFLADVLPGVERVGSFNSGLVTFHADVLAPPSMRRGIVNLDGVVDARTFAALKAGELLSWLDREGVRFVLDNAEQFATDARWPHACGRMFAQGFAPARDLVEIARFDVPGIGNGRPDGDSMRLYWLRGRGEPPAFPTGTRWIARDGEHAHIVLWSAAAGATLQAERDGVRSPLAQVEVDTLVVLWLDRDRLGTGRLFVDGAVEPVLVLPTL